ncbi:c-type cytochrome [Rhodoferax sp.]|uniref:c-type cytochrome n=1 Tax=Rhodoferax sp. TaxID=50421 RepID=UPI00276B7F5B|nr:cytochrome c [Rhodoferax sp.]
MTRERIALRPLLLSLSLTLACGAAWAADVNKGRQTYAQQCAICHGPSGTSVLPGAPNFSRGEALMRPDFTLLASVRMGKNAMPAFRGVLADRDILDVIAYLRTLH